MPYENLPDKKLSDEQLRNVELRVNQTAPAIGQVIGRHYLILEILGKGGMATTYKAKHLLLNKIVALKIIDQSVDGKSIMRFQQEAQTVASLSHPNIAALREFAYDDAGQPFLVMDYVLGRTLAEIIEDEEQLDGDSLVDIAVQIAQGLNHAHLHNVIHRDIKPSNIMIGVNQDGSRQVKLLDFGIARFGSGDDIQRLTSTGDLVGTPLYMSPEQSQGRRVDARSDVYSLGCVLYELATGRPPFTGASALEILGAHCGQIPEAPSAVAPKTDKKLNNLILKALAKDPAQRFQNGGEIADALERMTGKSGNKTLQRQMIFALLAGAVVIGAAGLSAFLWHHLSDRTDNVPTQAPVVQPAAEAAIKHQAELEQQEAEIHKALAFIEAGPKARDFNDLKAFQLLRLGKNQIDQLRPTQALSYLNEGQDLTNNQTMLSQILTWQGAAYALLNAHEKAVAALEEAAAKQKELNYKGMDESKMNGLNAIALGGTYENLGNELKAVGRFKEAEAAYLKAQKVYERNHSNENLARLTPRVNALKAEEEAHRQDKASSAAVQVNTTEPARH